MSEDATKRSTNQLSSRRHGRSACCLTLFITVIVIATVTFYWQRSYIENGSHARPKFKNFDRAHVYPPRNVNDTFEHHAVTAAHQTSISSQSGTQTDDSRQGSSRSRSPIEDSSYEPQVDVTNPTDPRTSFFTVRNVGQFTLCDPLELYIEARDRLNRVKDYGGDYFWVNIKSVLLGASQPADEIIDHRNGSYSARFTLHWTGTVLPRVTLVKSSEYVALLRHLRDANPARFAYNGRFTAGDQSEVTPCHITRDMYLGDMEPQRSRGFCDFSDKELVGYPWFCLKPQKLPCSAWSHHMGSVTRSRMYNDYLMRGENESVVHMFANIKQQGKPQTVKVSSGGRSVIVSLCVTDPLPPCNSSLLPRPESSAAGFYLLNSWHSLVCQVKGFNTDTAIDCLRHRSLYFFGDSTLRQWFEYLSVHLGRTMQEDPLETDPKVGPRQSTDKINNITLFYRHHGYPIRNVWTNVADVAYTPHEIDSLPAGVNAVVLLSFWAHFTPTNLTFYRDRWREIKAALRRLHRRAPDTPVVIKSANTREQQDIDLSNWYSMELDKAMREELSGEPGVFIIDVWDMTLGHISGYRIHPIHPVISQEIKMLLNVLCPS